MALTRRTLLHGIGTIGAAQTLFAAGGGLLVGCRKSPPVPATSAPRSVSTPSPCIHVLFEGPWLFYKNADNGVRAIAAKDAHHDCLFGKWNTPSGLSPLTKGDTGTWNLRNAPSTPPDFDKVVGGAFKSAGALWLSVATYHPSPVANNDFIFDLPVPDSVALAGQYVSGSITDSSGSTIARNLYAATVLRYNQQTGDSGGPILEPKTTTIKYPPTVNAGEDLVFRMTHNACPAPTDGGVQHVKDGFNELQKRILVGTGYASLTDNLKSVDCILNAGPDSISDDELGVSNAPPICPSDRKGLALFNNTMANCAGHGGGIGYP